MSGRRPVAWLVILCLMALGGAAAQSIAVRGGVSQLEQASGAGLTLSYSPYSMDIFSGSFQGRTEIGANVKAMFGHLQFIAGDQPLEIRSTIYGDQSRGFYARGASMRMPLGKRTHLSVFAGATGNANGSQLFELVRQNQAIGAVQLDYDMNKKLLFFSRSLFTSRQTVIGGVDFHPERRFHFGAQAGIGSNTPYAAFTGAYKTDTSSLEGSYAASKSHFRLVQVNTLNYQEPINENIHARHRFDHALQFDYRRSNFQFNAYNGTLSQYSGNTIFLAGQLGRTGWNAGYNQISGSQIVQGVRALRDGEQVNLGLNQAFGRFRVTASHYRPLSASTKTSMQSFTTIMTQEPLGRWASLRQIINRTSNWGVAYGGEVHSNWVNLSLDYQTTYSLFHAGQSQFRQGAVVEGDVNLPRGVKLFVNTNITPDGQFLYSWGLRTSFMGPYGGGLRGGEIDIDDTPEMPRYVVVGKVVDVTTDAPIPNFPVEIGAQTVFTNDDGVFSIRLFSGRLVAGNPDTVTPYKGFIYELVEGPKKVHPVKNKPGEEYVWKIRKLHAAASTGNNGFIVSNGADAKTVTPAPAPRQEPSEKTLRGDNNGAGQGSSGGGGGKSSTDNK